MLRNLKILRYDTVAAWTWKTTELSGTDCGICHEAFDACCGECSSPGDDCPPVWGACNHAFHMHCIIKWTQAEQSKQECPLCRATWAFK